MLYDDFSYANQPRYIGGSTVASLKDVAAKAGVSLSTASRALNNSKGLSKKTCEHVRKIAKELNYRPNFSARILAGKSSKMIGIIVPEIDSNYFSKMINAIEKKLQEHNYFLLIANSQYTEEKELQALDTFINYNVDGIFLACTIHEDVLAQYNKSLREHDIPLVVIEARLHSNDYNYIMIDDAVGMTNAVEYLLSSGHKRIGFISDNILDVMRKDQFRTALINNGLDPKDNPIYSHPSKRFEESGYETMQKILEDPNRPDAFLAGYDDIAIGAIRAIEEHGLSVPEDIAIIGNDNIRESPFLHKSLTTLSPPVEKMASLGVDLMIDCITNGEDDVVHRITLKPDLLIRETT